MVKITTRNDFNVIKSTCAPIYRPTKPNMATFNYCVNPKDYNSSRDFAYDFRGEFGIIPNRVIKENAVLRYTKSNNQKQSEPFYLISYNDIKPYLIIK